MKIPALTEAVRFLNQVRSKQDGGNPRQEQHRQGQEKQDPQEQPEPLEASSEQVDKAIEDFRADATMQASGLNANVVGSGPGLRVVLKDGSGAVLRQFTGEEFLRMREAASTGLRTRGKILDQKL